MKPKAWWKSLNVNRLVMASRPGTSLQPISLASAAARASPVSFCAMVVPLCGIYRIVKPAIPECSSPKAVTHRLDLGTDHCPHATRIALWYYYLTCLISRRETCNVLVPQYRQH